MSNVTTDVIGGIALVIMVSSILGAAARRCGQPVVVGQILTGVLLGPSVLLFHSDFTAIGEVRQGRSFLLFMGVAMSVTAMPVLAAIVRERGLAGSFPGVIATAVAGGTDVAARQLLAAALIDSGHTEPFSLPVTLLLTVCYTTFMVTIAPRAMSWWTHKTTSVLFSSLPLAFGLAMGSAWVTSSLGLQTVFGSFIAGHIPAHRTP